MLALYPCFDYRFPGTSFRVSLTHPTVPVRCSWQAQVTRGWKSLCTCKAASFLRY